jgi:hypothetical protein
LMTREAIPVDWNVTEVLRSAPIGPRTTIDTAEFR